MSAQPREADELPASQPSDRLGHFDAGSPLALGVVFVVFTLTALGLYAESLGGDFVSDDFGYIVTNPFVQTLSWENFLALLDPWGEPALHTANYAPVHLVGHSLEWALWGSQTTGYHVVNVVLHALTAVLFVAFLHSRSIPALAALLAGVIFLVHPANVEAVAWIFQLKTIMALGLSICALLAQPRRPALALVFYVLALLAKAQALYAIPVAATFAWCATERDDPWRRHAPWLLAWVVVSIAYAAPEFGAFQRIGETDASLHPDVVVQWRTIATIGTRYLAMAGAGYGLSAFHEPRPSLSWLDPWWIASLLFGGVLIWRLVFSLTQRRQEAAFWVWAGASFAPISQIFPFLHPIADRYLYFILPGLLGGVLCVGRDAWPQIAQAIERGTLRIHSSLRAAPVLAAATLALAFGFASLSVERARIWRTDLTVSLDSAANYPDGISAHFLRARRAARMNDPEEAVRELRGAVDRGWDRFFALHNDPAFAPVYHTPPMQGLVHELAAEWVAKSLAKTPTQQSLRVRAMAYLAMGQNEEAVAALEEALVMGGPRDDLVREELESLRAQP